MSIKEEDFNAWLENPVTEAVFALLEDAREQTMAAWNSASWSEEAMWRDKQAQYFRTACKARAEALEDIRNLTFEAFDDWQSDGNISD